MPRRVDKKKKAETIGQGALSAFRELGYHRTRMADIAREAGIGKGTLYEYFKDKDDILHFVLQSYFDAFKEGALRAMAPATTPGIKLLTLVDFAFDHAADWEDHCAVYVDSFSSARVGVEERSSLEPIYKEMRTLLRLLIEQGQVSGEIRADVEPRATAELLLSIFDGVILHSVFTEETFESSTVRKAATTMLIGGLFATSVADEPSEGSIGS